MLVAVVLDAPGMPSSPYGAVALALGLLVLVGRPVLYALEATAIRLRGFVRGLWG